MVSLIPPSPPSAWLPARPHHLPFLQSRHSICLKPHPSLPYHLQVPPSSPLAPPDPDPSLVSLCICMPPFCCLLTHHPCGCLFIICGSLLCPHLPFCVPSASSASCLPVTPTLSSSGFFSPACLSPASESIPSNSLISSFFTSRAEGS